ncbi:MAG TPA: ABC transporter permease [Bryobacteraceae bacterium]|jgi:ABC-2 type transport system permease protein|nr:ABC transporter permease [Bryobacteraceae bacterium]
MRNILTICGKELRSYFSSPVAYLLMALFGLIFGFFFYSATAYFVMAGLRSQMGGQEQPMSVNEFVIGPLLGNASVVGLFLMPLISMRLFAEEKRSGTIELLMTSPISDWEIIIGKWLGAMCMYLCIIAVSAINVGLLFIWGHPDPRPILTGYLGLILQGGTILALGTFISTTTKNQIIAGAATFSVCLLLWVLSWVSSYNEAPWAQAIAYCSILTHFEPFSRGIIDSKDVIFYLSAIFFGLFLTSRSLDSLRWRA